MAIDLKKDKKYRPENLVVMAIPNKNGYFSANALLAISNCGTPINTSLTRLIVYGEPGDDARSLIAPPPVGGDEGTPAAVSQIDLVAHRLRYVA